MPDEGRCKFCGESRGFIRSHIIPEAFYRPLLAEDGHIEITTSRAGQFGATRSTGIYDPQLVCSVCEARFSKYDTYAKALLLDREWLPRDATTTLLERRLLSQPCEYNKIKFFFLNLLWRSGATTVRPFDELNLGSHLERIHELLNADDPGTADEYAVLAMRFNGPHREIAGVDPANIIAAPKCGRVDGINVANFWFAGFHFVIKIDNRPFPQHWRVFQLTPKRDLYAIIMDFTTSPLSRAAHRVAQNDTRYLRDAGRGLHL